MRATILVLILLISCAVSAQLKIIPLRYNGTSNSRIVSQSQSTRVLSLPFWDDFSQTSSSPDTLLWKSGVDVFVNDGLAKNAPTYKVATLDGLRGDGIAHDILNEFIGLADSMATHYIDLSSYSVADSLYLSFYWQPGGFSELPDVEDTLSLHFIDADSTWERVWYANGGLETLNDRFIQTILPLDSQKYFHGKFRFKFQSIAKQSGPFDTWHLDYIYLNSARTKHDTLHFDRALTGNTTPLFAPYREIPAHIFFNDPGLYLKPQSVSTSNLDNTPHSVKYYYKLENLSNQEVYYDQEIAGAITDISGLQMVNIPGSLDVVVDPQINPLDSQIFQSTFYMFTGDKNIFEEVSGTDTLFSNVDLKKNDTIRQKYGIDNHYAYDDGTAEYAAGINVKNGKLAVKFAIYEPDTLTHIDIHFPNIDPDATGKSINVIVWSNLKNNIILTSQAYKITSNTKINEFKRIKLERTLLVRDTIYVGFQQLVEDYIGVGFDKTNPDAMNNIYYNTGESWTENNRLEGIFMIRPIFKFDSTFILSRKPEISQFAIYPNPSIGILNLSKPVQELNVYDLSGQLVYSSDSGQVHDIFFLENGIYLIKVYSENVSYQSRLILRK